MVDIEDGVEQNNVFHQNLGLVTRRKEVNGPGGTEAGLRSDWDAPSTYWITHPKNILTNSMASLCILLCIDCMLII
jgi:hypothetical protein